MQDRRITIRLLGERLGVGKKAARQILERDLQERKICSKFVPHFSTAEQTEHRVECWCSFIALLTKIVTCGKELWWAMKVGVVNSVKKRNDKAWNGVEQILPGGRMSGCTIACQDNTDLFFFPMLPELSTARMFLKGPQWTVTYLGVMERLYARMRHVRNERSRNHSCCCRMKRASSLRFRCEGISSFQIVLCDSARPFSPYLALAEFFSSLR